MGYFPFKNYICDFMDKKIDKSYLCITKKYLFQKTIVT